MVQIAKCINPEEINAPTIRQYSPLMGQQQGMLHQTGKYSPDFAVEECLSFSNGLLCDVIVINRSGASFLIPSDTRGPGSATNEVLIRRKMGWSGKVSFDLYGLFDAGSELHPSRKEMAKSFKTRTQSTNSPIEFVNDNRQPHLDYILSREFLEQHEHGLYVRDLDMVIAIFKKGEAVITHPYSLEGAERRTLNNDFIINDPDRREGFIMRIDIVDNEGEFGERFVNVMGHVYRIKAEKNGQRECGVYFYHSPDSTKRLSSKNLQIKHVRFEETDKLALLFRSPIEARTLGDLKLQREIEAEAIRHKNKLKEMQEAADLNTRKVEMESELFRMREKENDHKRVMATLEIEMASLRGQLGAQKQRQDLELETRRNREKEYYDRQSDQRRTFSDVLKWLPSVIVGLGAVCTTFL